MDMSSGLEQHFFRTETNLAAAEACRQKAERTKHLGDAIETTGKPLAIQVHGNDVWIAQSDALIKRINLESRKVVQVYKGHSAPATTLALFTGFSDSKCPLFLVSGSWDKTVKVWNTLDKTLMSSTEAHDDFVKCVYPLPELKMLVTSGADKVVRFWDLSDIQNGAPLRNIGLITAHSRPVQCIAARVRESSVGVPTLATFCTADSMGLIKIWELERTYKSLRQPGEDVTLTSSECTANFRATLTGELNVHRTGVNEIWYSGNQLWSASLDETACLTYHPQVQTQGAKSLGQSPYLTIQHPVAVRALLPLSLTPLGEPLLVTGSGEIIRLYDISSSLLSPGDLPELLSTTDAHWMDVVALGLWLRKAQQDGKMVVEPWIISASLDGTIRRWKLADLINPPKESPPVQRVEEKETAPSSSVQLTLEEEAELVELMDDD